MSEADFDVFGWQGNVWDSSKNPEALVEVIEACRLDDRSLPSWAADAICDLLRHISSGGTVKQYARPTLRRYAKFERQISHYLMVMRLRGLTKDEFKNKFGRKKVMDNIYAAAAEQLTTKDNPVTAEAVRKSWKALERLVHNEGQKRA